jgi:hypothetical protein
VTYIPLSTVQEKVRKNPDDILSGLRLVWEEGVAVVGTPTDAWPEWNPMSVLDAIAPTN